MIYNPIAVITLDPPRTRLFPSLLLANYDLINIVISFAYIFFKAYTVCIKFAPLSVCRSKKKNIKNEILLIEISKYKLKETMKFLSSTIVALIQIDNPNRFHQVIINFNFTSILRYRFCCTISRLSGVREPSLVKIPPGGTP